MVLGPWAKFAGRFEERHQLGNRRFPRYMYRHRDILRYGLEEHGRRGAKIDTGESRRLKSWAYNYFGLVMCTS
jgi:hypothetical protein